ncbi:MAG TPA: hypothetical protein VFA71_00170 [Terriglobales bacterium]|nr:hypothetical protein [Terriglobales bacterium]
MARSNRAAIGVNLLWLALILDGVATVLAWHRVSPGFALARLPILSVVGFVIWWFITAEVVAGRTWARIVYLLFTILEVLTVVGISWIPHLADLMLGPGGMGGLLAATKLVLQVAGIGIVLTNPAYGTRT